LLGVLLLLCGASSAAADDAADSGFTGSITGYYYAMRDQPDFGVGVAALNRGPLHLEARYNYEARDSTSVFVGWNFSGGKEVTYTLTPIVGGLFGATRAAIPGLEASVAWGSLDAYIEAEYVYDHQNHADSYFYSWTELGWKPVEWLRLGLAGQRTHTVQTGRDLQGGLFAQLILGKATLSLYAFNPDSGSRYTILGLGAQF
jgi:hypothetical protein